MRGEEVVFKGTKSGVAVILPDRQDLEEVKKRLERKLASSNNFFSGAEAILDLGERKADEQTIRELETLVQRHGMTVVKVVRSYCSETGNRIEMTYEPIEAGTVERRRGNQEDELSPDQTLLVRRTLRSGQKVNYPGNVVVLGDVNPGAEIVAGGDIIVVGSLRGVAHAGAGGNPGSIVVALRLRPTQLRIATQIARSPDGNSKGPNTPEVARIKEDAIVIESYLAAETGR